MGSSPYGCIESDTTQQLSLSLSDLLKAGLPQTFKLLGGRKQAKKAPPNSITANPDKVKCNKMKYACVGFFDSQ